MTRRSLFVFAILLALLPPHSTTATLTGPLPRGGGDARQAQQQADLHAV